ncbi:MAG: serine hydrolase domain-containing protein [Hydrogenophaga sp.]|uniref:serine hydrolase domain-containing protein n=1 Tax=Hydrogenophaga sp. TaxID=1904254 RepID=UPI002720803E|nr:serine hydrolase domain-containing protein [Hydrogenophaga sp.]MDO9568393.1 serine hydrolase domain-containing protein [Hydrogenophaga sp.]
MKHVRKPRSFLLLVAAIACTSMLAACGGSHPPVAPEAALTRVVSSQWHQFAPKLPGGLSITVITPEGEFFASTLNGATASSHFRGASTTKTFTAAAIMLLQQRGQLDIDHVLSANMPGTARPYLPATPGFAIPYKDQITIQQLLRHRGGVFDVGNKNVPATANAPYAGLRYVDWVEDTQGELHTFTLDELVGVVASNQLVGGLPGEAFRYSNTGYSLLAKIVEQVSGKTFAQFVHDEFLVPNGLNETSFPDDGQTQHLPAPFLEGTTRVGGTLYPTTHRNVSWGVGEGNVVTTPSDLARWFRRLLKGEAGLNAQTIARMRGCETTHEIHVSYGLGLACDPIELGAGHNGGITGYLTTARHDTVSDVTVVVFATLLDADDLMSEGEMLYETARQARTALGY